MPVFSKNIVRILDENNIKYPDDIVKILTPLGYKGAGEYSIGLGLDMTVDEYISTMNKYNIDEYKYNIPAKEYVVDKLTELKNNGHSLNVLTASPHSMLDVCLKRLNMYNLFDNVWSCDDFNLKKSEVEIYIRAAQRLNKEVRECSFVDDNVNAVSTAKKAGMIAVGIYDKSSESLIEEMKEVSDRYIYNMSKL